MIITLLAAVGALSFLSILSFLIRLVIALKSRCDFAAAMAPNPPAHAYRDKIVWITGASSGIGQELALQLAARGAKLILSSRREEVLREVAETCRSVRADVSVSVLPLDLSDLDSLPTKAKEALAVHGKIDILVNSGGVTTRAMARDSSFAVDKYLAEVDYLSYVALTKSLLPALDKNGGGSIVNMCSVSGKLGVPVRTSYCGAKFALFGYFDALRAEEELRGSNIRCLNVAAGSTRTAVAHNAIVKSPRDTFGQKDDNIETGLEVSFLCERMIAALYAGRPELWIAKPKELLVLYLIQYIPETTKSILAKSLAKQYAVEKKTQ